MIRSAYEITLLVTGLSVGPGKNNVGHVNVYGYDLMNGIISRAGNSNDLDTFGGKMLDSPGLTPVSMGRRFQCFKSRKA